MSLAAGLLAQNVLWGCESFSQCDIVLFLHVFKPLISFFYSEVFRAWAWEQKGVRAKSSPTCCEILWKLSWAIWDFLDVTLSGYFSCLVSFKFSKTWRLLHISMKNIIRSRALQSGSSLPREQSGKEGNHWNDSFKTSERWTHGKFEIASINQGPKTSCSSPVSDEIWRKRDLCRGFAPGSPGQLGTWQTEMLYVPKAIKCGMCGMLTLDAADQLWARSLERTSAVLQAPSVRGWWLTLYKGACTLTDAGSKVDGPQLASGWKVSCS